MNHMYPEDLYELNRQKIQRDQAFILKEEMLKPRSSFTYFLNLLGNWMIIVGEKLSRRYSFSAQTRKLDILHDSTRIFKA
jgi:hypothetical protein